MQKEKIKINIKHYHHSCGEPGCCDYYGAKLEVNGEDLGEQGNDAVIALEKVLEHLGYEIEINEEYDY